MLKLRSTNCLVIVVWQDKVEVDRKSLKWDRRMVDERIIVKWSEKYYVGIDLVRHQDTGTLHQLG